MAEIDHKQTAMKTMKPETEIRQLKKWLMQERKAHQEKTYELSRAITSRNDTFKELADANLLNAEYLKIISNLSAGHKKI